MSPDPKLYPKAKYHACEKPRLVNDPEEERTLGPDWFDHPNLLRDPNEPITVLEDVGTTPVHPSAAEVEAIGDAIYTAEETAKAKTAKRRGPSLQV